eukprot:2678153-Rhodomonas_salina.1
MGIPRYTVCTRYPRSSSSFEFIARLFARRRYWDSGRLAVDFKAKKEGRGQIFGHTRVPGYTGQ